MDLSLRVGLHEFAQASSNCGFQADHLARLRGPKDFYRTQRSQLKIRQGGVGEIGLGDGSRQLRGSLDQEHSGEQRLTRKMTAQKGFIAAHGIFSNPALARVQCYEAIEKTEFRSVREMFKGFARVFVHRLFLKRFDNLEILFNFR